MVMSPGPIGSFLHLAGLIKGQVQKPGCLILQPEGADAGHCLRLSNQALGVLHLGNVHVAGTLPRQKLGDPALQLRCGGFGQVLLTGQTPNEVQMAPDVVVEHRQIAAGHVGHSRAGSR